MWTSAAVSKPSALSAAAVRECAAHSAPRPMSASRRFIGMPTSCTLGMRCSTHRAAPDLAQTLEHVERALAGTDVVHAGDHTRRDDSTGLQRTTASRGLGKREGERAERTLAHGRDAAPDELVVDEGLRRDFVQPA